MKTHWLLLAVVVVALPITYTCEANARATCMSTAKAKAVLAAKHQEQMVGRGLSSAYVAYELYLSPDGSWTILRTTAAGVSCQVAAGKDWDFAKPNFTRPSH